MDLTQRTLGDLARDIPGATAVFHAHGLDFCCGGRHTLDEAARRRGLEVAQVAAALARLPADAPAERDWRGAGNAALIAHLLGRYHATHRTQLPELSRLARRVEQVHAAHPLCPAGLADHLVAMQQELESHMQKEEQVLFPVLQRGGALPAAPIACMRFEHEQHGESLERLQALARHLELPPGACNTWQALYRGLRQFREDLMHHIHLENNVLFEGLAATAVAVGHVDPATAATAAPAAATATPAAMARGCGCGGAGSGGGCA